eukprot:GHVP01059984.1.p1 GENE.GHVP01059984.1~~GHVP01059984.1.p1  ORF type:complete len:668 (-),score=117.24 GHVP01059984.1:94-2097(-)
MELEEAIIKTEISNQDKLTGLLEKLSLSYENKTINSLYVEKRDVRLFYGDPSIPEDLCPYYFKQNDLAEYTFPRITLGNMEDDDLQELFSLAPNMRHSKIVEILDSNIGNGEEIRSLDRVVSLSMAQQSSLRHLMDPILSLQTLLSLRIEGDFKGLEITKLASFQLKDLKLFGSGSSDLLRFFFINQKELESIDIEEEDSKGFGQIQNFALPKLKTCSLIGRNSSEVLYLVLNETKKTLEKISITERKIIFKSLYPEMNKLEVVELEGLGAWDNLVSLISRNNQYIKEISITDKDSSKPMTNPDAISELKNLELIKIHAFCTLRVSSRIINENLKHLILIENDKFEVEYLGNLSMFLPNLETCHLKGVYSFIVFFELNKRRPNRLDVVHIIEPSPINPIRGIIAPIEFFYLKASCLVKNIGFLSGKIGNSVKKLHLIDTCVQPHNTTYKRSAILSKLGEDTDEISEALSRYDGGQFSELKGCILQGRNASYMFVNAVKASHELEEIFIDELAEFTLDISILDNVYFENIKKCKLVGHNASTFYNKIFSYSSTIEELEIIEVGVFFPLNIETESSYKSLKKCRLDGVGAVRSFAGISNECCSSIEELYLIEKNTGFGEKIVINGVFNKLKKIKISAMNTNNGFGQKAGTYKNMFVDCTNIMDGVEWLK